MADVLYAMGMRKLIREWYKGKVYEISDCHSYYHKIRYEIINCRVNAGLYCPHIILDINVKAHWSKTYFQDKWVKRSKPSRFKIRDINRAVRRIVIEDKIKEIGMFGFDGRDYNICIGNIKWVIDE